MKAVYLTKEVLGVFDKMTYTINFRKIIGGLQASMNKTDVAYGDRVILSDDNISVKILKEILGDSFINEDDMEAFVFIFKEKINNPETSIVDIAMNKIEKEMGHYKNQLAKEQEGPVVIVFTTKFWEILDKIRNSDIVWELYSLDSNTNIKNPMGINSLDVSDKEWYFDIKTNGKPGKIKVAQFLRYFFPNKFTTEEISKFTVSYNRLIGGKTTKKQIGELIKPREFKYDPKNIKETFISLCTETYPMGHEEEVVPFITPGLTRDEHGNYYTIIGESDTAFTCHLDTASRTKSKVGLINYQKDGQDFIMTDGTSILGADDKSGVAIIMYMIEHKIPGVYWFFMGEERGGVGSGKVANDLDSYPFMNKIKKMISFDRRNYYSVITSQMGLQCCSNEFGESLCKELNKSGLKINLDPTGVFTDSANFIDVIPECTNISVGYFNEHTHDEMQNITYLERLAKACLSVEWDKLEVKRKVGFDDEISRKYHRLIKSFKRTVFFNRETIKGMDGKILINLEVTNKDVNHLYNDMAKIEQLLRSHKLDPDIKFNEDSIKIEFS